MESEKREYFRVSVGQLTSIIKNSDGNYEVVDKSTKLLDANVSIKDISLGGLRIELVKEEFKKGTSCDIVLPKIKDLDGEKLKCEVTRAEYRDGEYSYDVGLKFLPANTDYLKKFMEIIKTHYME
ncbi:MAG: PilZ domain-containing protein [Nitrospina sp.]|jgi:hypothetical protein|nr:PilZ domain-containing protein [Nitrospina sp.]